MLSQNVAKMPVPSGSHFRTRYPHPQFMDQWRGVYYFAGISKVTARKLLLDRKRAVLQENRAYEAAVASTVKLFETVKLPSAQQLQSRAQHGSLTSRQLVEQCVDLYGHGLLEEGGAVFDVLQQSGSLSAGDYEDIIRSLGAPQMQRNLEKTNANFDPTMVKKLMADRRGSDRFLEATRVWESCLASLTQSVGIAPTNELMNIAFNCGFESVQSVSDRLYDSLESLQLAPNAETYRLVALSLGLQGRVEEADAVFRFVRQNYPEEVTTSFITSMMEIYRDNKLFEECDALWAHAATHQSPKPDVATAELYLRSIVDRSYQTTTDDLNKFGPLGTREKKRVPVVLQQMEKLGIPRTELSTPLQHEVEDALRKFSIHKHRFYEWGRATKQFSYIEGRRAHGWLYDMKEMMSTKLTAPNYRHVGLKSMDAVVPMVAAELPAFMTAKESWKKPPLDDVLNRVDLTERMDGGRGGDVFYEDRKPIHERSTNWMTESPQTRYDQLYGINNPDIPTMGIRRHLTPEYATDAEGAQRDARIVRKALNSGRRIRKKQEASQTHRNSDQ